MYIKYENIHPRNHLKRSLENQWGVKYRRTSVARTLMARFVTAILNSILSPFEKFHSCRFILKMDYCVYLLESPR